MSEGPHMGGECNPMDNHLNPMPSRVCDTLKGETHTLEATNTRGNYEDPDTITSHVHQSDKDKNKFKGEGTSLEVSVGIGT